MKILIADDDPMFLRLMEVLLKPEYEVVTASDGQQAFDALQAENGPAIAVLDWQMPQMEGLEVCRRVRQFDRTIPVYLLLVTSRDNAVDIRAGFAAGADDYVTKPIYPDELADRIAVGRRVVQLQVDLAAKVATLEGALARVHQLEGLLPICAWCKKIRNGGNCWEQLETYLSEHSDLKFTHGICPECLVNLRRET